MRVKMSKQPQPAPTASAVGPCPTIIQIVGRPSTGSLPSTIAPPDHPGGKRRERTEESKMSKPTPTRTYVIRIVGRPGTGSLPSTIAPPDHPPKMYQIG